MCAVGNDKERKRGIEHTGETVTERERERETEGERERRVTV